MIASRLLRYFLLILAVICLAPAAARADWHGGWHGGGHGGWGWRGGVYLDLPPVYVPPPVYYYPPPVYPGPPVYAVPPEAESMSSNGPPPPAQACYAGQWVCPLERPNVVGNACSCPTGAGRAWGRAR